MTACVHCGRDIVQADGAWIDPQATGDDSVWRETCDSHDTFTAEHEPACAYASDHHSADIIAVYHGRIEPVRVCGYHASRPDVMQQVFRQVTP